MESSYSLALKELEAIRNKNRQIDAIHHSEVVLKAPEIENIENELMKNGTALLKCVLNKGDGFENIKASIQSLQKRKASLLIKNGFPEDYLDETVSCKLCSDTGFKDGKRCVCHKNLIMKYISQNSNLTDAMREHTFDRFDFSLYANQPPVTVAVAGSTEQKSENVLKFAKALYKKSAEFAEDFDKTERNLIFSGSTGTGKTFLSSCIANRALERGKTVYYQSSFKLFEIFENVKFQKNNYEENEDIIKYVYDADLLIIDDLGTEFITQYTSAVFFDILNTRMGNKKSTVISTNLSLNDINSVYSRRVASRIVGDFTVLYTVGNDLRREKKLN